MDPFGLVDCPAPCFSVTVIAGGQVFGPGLGETKDKLEAGPDAFVDTGGSMQGAGSALPLPGSVRRDPLVDLILAGIRSIFLGGLDEACSKWFSAALATSENRVYGSLDNFLANIIPV